MSQRDPTESFLSEVRFQYLRYLGQPVRIISFLHIHPQWFNRFNDAGYIKPHFSFQPPPKSFYGIFASNTTDPDQNVENQGELIEMEIISSTFLRHCTSCMISLDEFSSTGLDI